MHAGSPLFYRSVVKSGLPMKFLPFALLALTLPVFAQDDELNWIDNYRDALKQARETGKPIFLEFRCEP